MAAYSLLTRQAAAKDLRELASIYLSDADVLAILLQGPAGLEKTQPRAQKLLDRLGGLRAVMDADVRTLGPVAHAKLNAAVELVRRAVEETLRNEDGPLSPAVVSHYVLARLQNPRQEGFALLLLDKRHRLIHFAEMFQGTLDSSSVPSRDVVLRALHHQARAVICCRTTLSGCSEPLPLDLGIVQRLRTALEPVDVWLFDYLIIGDTVVSMAERGLLK